MITVFTPTYNRGKLLYRLWESLEEQEYRNFEWIVVDDGSVDNTESIMHDINERASFSIIYMKKENEGKHIAINVGSKLASGEWFFIVDSDDYLSKNALALVDKYCSQIEVDDSFAGVAGLRGNKDGHIWASYIKNNKADGKYNKDYLNKEFIDAEFAEYKFVIKAEGDRAEVVRTDLLRKYPFPKFGDENFLVESYFWLKLSYEGLKFRWFNEIIYITEYRDDGLTRNISNVYKKNPIGAYNVENIKLLYDKLPLKLRIRTVYSYYRYGLLAHEKYCNLLRKCNDKFFSPLGVFLALLRP